MAGLLDPMKGDGTWVENRPSKWQQTWGILEPYVMGPVNAWEGLKNADLNTLLYDTGPAARQAVENSFNVAGTVTGGSSVASKPANSLNMGFRVFHGSPHDFPPVRLIEMPDGQRLYQNMGELADTPQGARIIQEYPMGRFDLSKIGTGEGAQAYGHGLYFADSEGVARSYRDALSNRDGSGYATAHLNAQNLVSKVGGDAEYAAQVLRDQLEQGGDEFTTQKLKDTLDFITSGKYAEPLPPAGRMYEVEIDADPDAFLDWDKPLSEQPGLIDKLQSAIGLPKETIDYWRGSLLDDLSNEGPMGYSKDRLTRAIDEAVQYGGYGPEFEARVWDEIAEAAPNVGAEFRDILSRHAVSIDPQDPGSAAWKLATGAKFSEDQAREALKQAGIPGIKYLDAGSRAAGDGSRNYVVFDDSLVDILRKYGIAGLLGGGTAAGAMMSEPQGEYQ
jgi:hypothetical protein